MKSILKIMLMIGLTMSLHAATTVVQSFSNNSVGTITDGNSAILTTNPNFSSAQIGAATQLEIVVTLTGDAHMFIQSLDPGGRQHDADLLTQVGFDHVNTGSPLFLTLDSLELMSLSENPFVSGNASGDTSEVFPVNPMSYTASWTTTDVGIIASINGTALDFQATPDYTLGADSQFNELFGGATYSNFRLEDVGYQVDFQLTTVPEPSSSALLGLTFSLLVFRRNR